MTSPSFEEQAPHEAGFAKVFAQEIAPELESIERRRRRLLRKFLFRVGVSTGGLIALIAFGLALPIPLSASMQVLPTLVVIVLVVAAIWAHGPYKQHTTTLRDVLVGPICRFLGALDYTRKPSWGYAPLKFRKLGLIPRYGRAEVEDLFEGSHRDTAFRFAEVRLIRGGGRYQVTVFEGLLFEIEVPVSFDCQILILPNRGLVGNKIAEMTGRWLSGPLADKARMRFGDAGFERHFTVYADDPDAAIGLMPSGFREILTDLARDYRPAWWRSLLKPFRRRSMSGAFAHKSFHLALATNGDLFEMGSLLRSTYSCEEDIRRFLREVVASRQVIDYLHGDPQAKQA